MYLNLGVTVKTVFIRKFIAVNAYIKNQERFQIKNLTLHNKDLEKERQIKLNARKVQCKNKMKYYENRKSTKLKVDYFQ